MVFYNKIKRNIYNILIFIHHFILFYSCHLKLTKFCAFLIKISFHQPKIFRNEIKNKKIIIVLDRVIGGRRDFEIMQKSSKNDFHIIFLRRSIVKIIFFYFFKKKKIFFNYHKPKPSKKDYINQNKKDRKQHEEFWTEVIFYLKNYYKNQINFVSFAYYFWVETGIYAGCSNNNIPVKLWNKECFMSDEDVKHRIKINEYKNVFKYFNKISVYNNLMKKMLIAMDKSNKKKIMITGCPRIYDFIKKKQTKRKIKNILFLSFNTKQGIPDKKINNNLNWNLTYDNVIKILNDLSNNKNIKINIKRKNSFTYKTPNKISSKIKVYEGGTAEKFINNADLIIGQNSGSTIEALINGKIVMVPFFEKKKNLKKYLYKFNKSIVYTSEHKMKNKILIFINKKATFPLKNKNNEKTIKYYYGSSKNVIKNCINFLNS